MLQYPSRMMIKLNYNFLPRDMFLSYELAVHEGPLVSPLPAKQGLN